MYYTILVTVGSYDYENGNRDPNEKEIAFNANSIYSMIERIITAFRKDRSIEKAYVGFPPSFGKLYDVGNFKKNELRNQYLKDFSEKAKDQLQKWPDEIDIISLTLKFGDNFGLPTDLDLKKMSYEADISCEAILADPYTGSLILQGYERGDYDTGYLSNDKDST